MYKKGYMVFLNIFNAGKASTQKMRTKFEVIPVTFLINEK